MEGRQVEDWGSLLALVGQLEVPEFREVVPLDVPRIDPGERNSGPYSLPNKHFRCASCHHSIRERNIHEAFGRHWHRKCLRCAFCRKQLRELCHVTVSGKLCCRRDHCRLSQVSCAACDFIIARGVQVHHVMGNVYHRFCFRCVGCDHRLNAGSKVYLRFDHKLECAPCFNRRFQRC